MSLDQNLFTLNLTTRADDRNVVDLVDPKGVTHYTKVRVPANEYKIEVYDPLSGSILATITAPTATSKQKTVQLYNPDIIVELKYTGTLTFKWGFKWEDHEFEWKREECYIIRKPDPSVLVAVTKEPPGRLQTRAVQILDYNLTRFDIQDRKGLEIVILAALLSFQDLNETYHTPRDGNTPATTPPAYSPTPVPTVPIQPPAVPPRPEPRTGVERVAEMHAVRTAQGEGDANEIEVGEECSVDDYAQYAERLLNDEAMLFVSVRSASAAQVPKVLRVVEETKRLRHKSGIAEDEELHQYVIYDTEKAAASPKGPRRINLNDPDPKRDKGKDKDDKYIPPTSLTVHLSKIDMPELRPKANLANMRRPSGSGSPEGPQAEMSDKERRRLEKEAKKAEKESKKKDKKKDKDPQKDYAHAPPPPVPNKLSRPPPSGHHSSPSFSGYHTPAHMVHPHQPSPSPSQLNNPGIYAAPPPSMRARPVSMAFPMPFASSSPPAGANVGYLSSPTQSGRPTSIYQSTNQSSSGKGPVSALLDMWSKH